MLYYIFISYTHSSPMYNILRLFVSKLLIVQSFTVYNIRNNISHTHYHVIYIYIYIDYIFMVYTAVTVIVSSQSSNNLKNMQSVLSH